MTDRRKITLVEVGPRDGLQAEARILSADVRARLISLLDEAGLGRIEAGAFVSERLVPQMAETGAVLERTTHLRGRLGVLVANLRGFERALAAGAREVAVLTAASESFAQDNLHCGVAASLERARAVADAARAHGVRLRGYISCVFGCPHEGETSPRLASDLARALYEMGCEDISLADTFGVAAPLAVRRVVDCISRETPLTALAGHFHDTFGQALPNILACVESGMSIFDCSIDGLGGCPFAPGAAGNVATEDVVYMLNGSGFETGVSLEHLLGANAFVSKVLDRTPQSKVARALSAGARARALPGS